jgi:hypothetical protein
LAEVGAIAAYAGNVEHADKIYDTIAEIAPDISVHILGKAMNFQASGDLTSAILTIENADLTRFNKADQNFLKAMLALYLKLDGQGHRYDTLKQEILKDSSSQAAVDLINSTEN